MSRPNRSTHQPAATALFLMSTSPSAPLSVCLAMHAPIWHQAASSRSSSPMMARSVLAGSASSSASRLAAGRRDRSAAAGSGASWSSSAAGWNPATSDWPPSHTYGRPRACRGMCCLGGPHRWRYAWGTARSSVRLGSESDSDASCWLSRQADSTAVQPVSDSDEAVSEANMVALQAFWPAAGLRWLAPSAPL